MVLEVLEHCEAPSEVSAHQPTETTIRLNVRLGTRRKRRREIEVIGCLPLGTPKGGSGEDPERCPKILVVGPAFLHRHIPHLEQRLREQFHRRRIDGFCTYKSIIRTRQ